MSDKVDFDEIVTEFNLENQEVIFGIIKVRGATDAPTIITRKSQVVDLVSHYFTTKGYLQNGHRPKPDWVQPDDNPTPADKKGNKNSSGVSSEPHAYSKAASNPRSAQSTVADAQGEGQPAFNNTAGNLRRSLDANTAS